MPPITKAKTTERAIATTPGMMNGWLNTNLPMPFDPDLVGWLSATESLEDLFNWFSKEDIERLEKHGWFITVYEAENVKQYKNHLVICQETSIVKERLSLACV